jgi:hypothetical protein
VRGGAPSAIEPHRAVALGLHMDTVRAREAAREELKGAAHRRLYAVLQTIQGMNRLALDVQT